MFYGGDYNPEQWPEEVWTEDVALMRRAGVNLVTVGVFAWARLEPAPGTFTFDWLDRVLDLLGAGGVRVALATPTASPPPWFTLRHPDALPVTADGTRLVHGSRDTYCAAAPAYLAAADRIVEALADRYARHPALAMWHVHNEYGTTCHCPHATDAFRRWLRERHGGLDALNDAWAGAFWGQHYSSWDEVFTPRATQYLANPGQLLDFRRFWSDQLLRAYSRQRDRLRAANPAVPVTTNFAFGGWVPVDHARWAGEVDLVAIDQYPDDAGPGAEEQTAFAADLARSWAGGKPWLLMESAPNLIYTPGRMHAKEPGRMIRHSLANVARGSRGAMFFQWRAPRGGAERFHAAMVPHAGPDSGAFRETVELGGILARIADLDGDLDARVAVVWDAPSWWALQGPGLPAADLDYLDEVRAAHRALWRAGITADFCSLDSDLSRYRMIVLPAGYLASAEPFRSYVYGGGHLVVTYLSGIADEHGRVLLGGYPGALRELLGVRVEEFRPLPPGVEVTLSTGDTGRRWSELVHLTGATAVASYVDGAGGGPARRGPAITRHRFGSGTAWYTSTRLDDTAYQRWLSDVATEAGVVPSTAPAGVEVVRRGGWLVALNHTDRPQRVPADGVDLVGGADVTGSIELPPGGAAVVRQRDQAGS
jgi:beta-galactosidase